MFPRLLFEITKSLKQIDKEFLSSLLIENLKRIVNKKPKGIVKQYWKELKELFGKALFEKFSLAKLVDIYLNFNFIVNLEQKYDFSNANYIREVNYIVKDGYVEELRIWGLYLKKVSDINGIEKLTKLKVLDLSGNCLEEIDGLENNEKLTLLKFGCLHYNLGNDIKEIKGLESLKNLKVLNLSNNNISEMKGLECLIDLEYLYLVNNRLKEIKGLDRNANLIYLNLENNLIKEIKGIDTLNNLKTLVLGKNIISIINDNACLKNLNELRIYGNPITQVKDFGPSNNPIYLVLDQEQIANNKGVEKLKSFKIKKYQNEKPIEYTSRYRQ